MTVADAFSYSHLLGLTLDAVLAPGARTGSSGTLAASGEIDAAVSSCLLGFGRVRWPRDFPHLGAPNGRVVLEPWQQTIVEREPEAFLRGLLQSDGARVTNRFTTRLQSGRVAEYAYPRYFFSSPRADVRDLFCAGCERIGVEWTQNSRRTISVAHRRSVARLDELFELPTVPGSRPGRTVRGL